MARQWKKEYWTKIIDGTKSGVQIANELKLPPATVYNAARRYNLPLPKACTTEMVYHGVTLQEFKRELQVYTLRDVAKIHSLNECCLKSWLVVRGVDVPLSKPRKQPVVISKPLKRCGNAIEMIKYLTTKFTDKSIASVFGYSAERIGQIRKSMEEE